MTPTVLIIVLVIGLLAGHAIGRRIPHKPAPKPKVVAPKPRALFEPGKPSREPFGIFSWTVRKQDNGRFAVVPYDKDGNEMWSRAYARDITDPMEAWNAANLGRAALGWIEK